MQWPESGVCGEGFLFITTDDADDAAHCENDNCGGLFPSTIRYALTVPSTVPSMRGVLAVLGSRNGIAATTFHGWYQRALAQDARVAAHPVTYVTTASELLAQDLRQYKLLYISSDQ